MSGYALGGRDALGRAWLALLVLGAATVLAVVATLAPAAALALVLGLGFLVATFRSLTWGAALFTVIAFFDRIPAIGGLESNAAKGAGAALAAAWLIAIATRGRDVPLLLRSQPVVAYAAAFFVCWAMMSALWAESSGSALSSAFRLALNVLLLFIVFSAIRTARDLRLILGAYIAGAALTAVVGLAGGTSAEASTSADEVSRLAGQIGDPNEFAAALVPALVFAAFLFASRSGALLRWVLATCILLFGLGLFLTNSRGGLVALAATFIVTIFLAGPVRSRAIVVILLVGAVGFSYYTLVAPPEALQRITHFSAGGGTGREDLWTIALEIYRDNPVAGIGIGNFELVEPRYALTDVQLERVDLVVDTPKVAHNTYLHVLTELGLVGFVAIGIVILGSLVAVRRAIRSFRAQRDVELEVLARGIAIATIGMLAAFAFISAQYEKQLWLLIGIAAATATVARRAPGAAADDAYDLAVREQLVEQLEQRVVERMDALLAEQEKLSRRRAQLAAREQELRERMRELEERERGLAAAPAAAPAPAQPSPDLERLRAQNTELEARVRELEARKPERIEVPTGPPPEVVRRLEAHERELAQRAQQLEARGRDLEERVRTLTTREQALAKRAAELAGREAQVAERERAPAPPPPQPRPVQPPPQAPPPAAAQQAPPQSKPAPAGDRGAYNLSELEALVGRRRGEFPDRADEWESYLFFLRDHAAADGTLPTQFDALIDDVFGDLLGR